jgi:hypothetical protein
MIKIRFSRRYKNASLGTQNDRGFVAAALSGNAAGLALFAAQQT